MNVRIRRLEADQAAMERVLGEHPRIEIVATAGRPAQRYHLRFRVKGLSEGVGGELAVKEQHLVEVSLLQSYPRQPPVCRMLTPVFHPNIAPHAICIGDNWSAGESLVALVLRIGEMITFQSYNVKSPLNGVAAQWVEDNVEHLPLEDCSFAYVPPADGEIPGGAAEDAFVCGHCHRRSDSPWTCPSGHSVCPDCRTLCMQCGGFICGACPPMKCGVCGSDLCPACATACSVCGRPACAVHRSRCDRCARSVCEPCLTGCPFCEQRVCRDHVEACRLCGRESCVEHGTTCRACGRRACAACAATCAICGEGACRDHAALCPVCKQVVCRGHFREDRASCTACLGAGEAPLGPPPGEEPLDELEEVEDELDELEEVPEDLDELPEAG